MAAAEEELRAEGPAAAVDLAAEVAVVVGRVSYPRDRPPERRTRSRWGHAPEEEEVEGLGGTRTPRDLKCPGRCSKHERRARLARRAAEREGEACPGASPP